MEVAFPEPCFLEQLFGVEGADELAFVGFHVGTLQQCRCCGFVFPFA